MRAYLTLERETSPRGFLIGDEITPLADPNNPRGTHYFTADELPMKNHALAAEMAAESAYRSKYPGAEMAGLFFRVHKHDRTKLC